MKTKTSKTQNYQFFGKIKNFGESHLKIVSLFVVVVVVVVVTPKFFLLSVVPIPERWPNSLRAFGPSLAGSAAFGGLAALGINFEEWKFWFVKMYKKYKNT